MRILLTLIVMSGILSTFVTAQQEGLIRAIDENTYSLDLDAGGPGFDLLSESIRTSDFTMIGEAHGIAQVQEVSSALFALAAQDGYDVMVVETDPYSASKVAQLAAADETETKDFVTKYPMAIPFFHSEEGMAMARVIARAGGDFWGVDQVFVVGPRYLFAKLAKVAESHEANQLAAAYAQRAQDAFASAMANGNPDEVLLMQLEDEDFDKLRRAFKGEESAVEMIDQIQLSREIYQHWYDGEFYLNNKVRSDLMKRLFIQQYNKAVAKGEKPKVMFKLGSNHSVRGLTSTNIFDIGNTVSELADMSGQPSTHIKLTGAKGSSYNMLSGVQEFDATIEWHDWLKEALKDKLEVTDAEYLMIDLRPLRKLSMREVDTVLKDLIFGFDFWIIITEALPVTPLSP